MKNQKWKYKITSGVSGVILSAIMLAGFGALALWMHKTQNDAIIIGKIIVLFAAVAFVLALYRAIFFKVLIGKDGFFYQSNPFNGRHYKYYEIKKAWISSGRETNANEMNYCNYETNEGDVIRFFYTGADMDAIQYFLKRIEKVQAIPAEQTIYDGEYKISGRVQGKQRIAVTIFVLGILLVVSNSLMQQGFPPLMVIIPVIVAVIAVVYVIVYYFFYKLGIEKAGFYCQTNPFNGKYYKKEAVELLETLGYWKE